MTEPLARLDDLMLSAGVLEYPAWFHEIRVPHWPMPHQLDTMQEYPRHLRYGDFSDPGTGKTYPAQMHAILMAALGDNKVCFTMPPKLIRQFRGEFKEFFQGIDDHLDINDLDVGAVQKSKRLARWDKEGWPDILLISYDTFREMNGRSAIKVVPKTQWKLEDGKTSYWNSDGSPKIPDSTPYTKDKDPVTLRKKAGTNKYAYRAKNRNQLRLKGAGYNVFFFDEAHALCNPESQAWKSVRHMDTEMGDDAAMYLMTGTPIPTHLYNVYGLIAILDSGAYLNHSQFMRKHVILNPNLPAKYKSVIGYDKEEEIYHHLYKHSRRVQKRDVLPLKDPIISSEPVVLAGKHKKLYDQIINDRFAILGDTVLTPDNDSALRMLALQIISCPDEFDTTGEIGQDNELTKWLDAKLDSINPANHKIIVFAYFKRTIAFLAKRYAQWNPAVMNGATTHGWQEVDRFRDDPDCRLFFVNWGSGGAGLNLQVSSHIIFYECPTSPKDAKQGIGRSDRKGQESIVNVYFPRVINTLFDKNFRNLLKNEEQNNEVVRDKHDLLYKQLKVSRPKAA